MRIGTWNLAGRWDGRHARLMQEQNCDVWLITEVNDRLSLEGYAKHPTAAKMAKGRAWSAILSRQPVVGHADPHPASAMASLGELTLCSSILPWRSCARRPPWIDARHADQTKAAVEDLFKVLPTRRLVWGGDWNHALSGPEYAGSQGGRRHILSAVAALDLKVPTTTLPHRLPSLLSIDHIAVPNAATVVAAVRVAAIADGLRLSDHDAYVVEVS